MRHFNLLVVERGREFDVRSTGSGDGISMGALSHSLFTRSIPAYAWSMPHMALRWSAGIWTYRILSTCRSAGSRKLAPTRIYQVILRQWQAGQDRISIALAIHSLDQSLSICLIPSGVLKFGASTFLQTCRPSGALDFGVSAFLQTCRPAGALDFGVFTVLQTCGSSIALAIHSFDPCLRSRGTCRTLRSAGAREFGHIAFYPRVDPLDRGNARRQELNVTCGKDYSDKDNGALMSVFVHG